MGVAGFEPAYTEVEGFTVGQNPTKANAHQRLSTYNTDTYGSFRVEIS